MHGVTSQKTITTAVEIANIEVPELLQVVPKMISLSLSCLAVLLWSGEKIRDKNIYRPEPVLSMSATWCSKNTHERRLFLKV